MSEQPTQSKQPKQPKPNPLDRFMGRFRKTTPKASPAPSPNSSRSTTPAPSNREESSPGAAAVLSSNPESAPRGIEKGADSLKGGDTAKTDNSDAVHLPGESSRVGPTHGSSPRVDMHVYGGTGGTGGAGTGGGPGGTGEGPKFDFRDSNVTLTDPHVTKLQFIKEKLAGHVAAQYKFTDQSKSLCAPGTRVEIQANILEWLSLQPRTKEHIFWITGIAGSGKSTLSATVVENLRENHTPVAAQFFISRNIPETVDPSKIIPTIAKQLAKFSPAAADIIHDVLNGVGAVPRKYELVDEADAIVRVFDPHTEAMGPA